MRILPSLAAIFFLAGASVAQRSPFTGLEVRPPDSTGHYRLLIGGHFHGTSTNRSGYPAATLLANLDTIAALDGDLFLSTGDLFMDPVHDRPRYDRVLFRNLRMPFFNARGNHDGDDGGDQLRLDLGPDRVLILDSERDASNIEGEQLAQIAAAERDAASGTLRRLFIVSHRPVWAEGDAHYEDLFAGNTRSLTGSNFKREVLPLLKRITAHANVFWISGSMGGRAPSSIFFQSPAPHLTFIQCAIRDEPRDALLLADLYPDTVKWGALSLTGLKLMAPERYDAAWWRENLGKSEGFNWRLLPYLIRITVLHRAFWIGFATATLAILLLVRWRRRSA